MRSAEPRDVAVMLRFIRELAEYEREPDAVVATEADLLRDGFGLAGDGVTPLPACGPARFRAAIAEWDGAAAGFALYFTSYSTWLGRHGIRLEDLYVTPEMRGRGIGRALLQRLAAIAVSEGCERLEWDVLAWNQPALDVYHRVGAWVQTEWRIMRVAGEKLRTLAAGGSVVDLATTDPTRDDDAVTDGAPGSVVDLASTDPTRDDDAVTDGAPGSGVGEERP